MKSFTEWCERYEYDPASGEGVGFGAVGLCA